MKKISMIMLMVFMLSGGAVVSFASNNEQPKTPEVNVRNINAQAQGQIQAQGQLQGQAQFMNNGQSISPSQNITVAEVVDTPQINPITVPLYQNGKIGDITIVMPNFKGMKKLSNTDIIVKVLKVEYGNIFSRIKLEDLETKLMSTKIAGDKIRYSVKFKDSVSGVGIGGGVGAARASVDGLTSTAGSIIPGFTASTVDPKFIITYYEVE